MFVPSHAREAQYFKVRISNSEAIIAFHLSVVGNSITQLNMQLSFYWNCLLARDRMSVFSQ